MTAGKDQAQPIIFKAIILKALLCIGTFRRTPLRFEISHELVLSRIKSCPSTQSINGFESGGRNEPGPRFIRYAGLGPHVQSGGKGLVHRLLGEIKITEQADQSCQDSSRIHAIKGVEQFAYLLGGTLGHDDDLSKPATPDQFGKRRIDARCPGRDSEIWTTERFLGWFKIANTLIRHWPLPPLRPKRASYGVAVLRSGVAKETHDML